MSPRKVKILSLMAQKERRDLSTAAVALNDVARRQMQHFDMVDRLSNLLNQTSTTGSAPMSRGQLQTAMWMGQTLTQQLNITHSQLAEIQEERKVIEHHVAHHSVRERILSERALEARQIMLRERAEKLPA